MHTCSAVEKGRRTWALQGDDLVLSVNQMLQHVRGHVSTNLCSHCRRGTLVKPCEFGDGLGLCILLPCSSIRDRLAFLAPALRNHTCLQ
jgi:hypothetical protein